MLRRGHVFAIIIAAASLTTVLSIHAEDEALIPSWIKNTAGFWVSGDISDAEYISTIEWMIENKLIKISSSEDDQWKRETAKLYNENQGLKGDMAVLEKGIKELQDEYNTIYRKYTYYLRLSHENDADSTNTYEPAPSQQSASPDYYEPATQQPTVSDVEQYCYGSADCFSGYVTKITDGDTIEVDGKPIRFALVNTPEYGEYGFEQATNYIKTICPVGSVAIVDEDDRQTQGSYGRIIALVLCVGVPTSLNQAVVEVGLAEISTNFCSKSEFASQAWAQIYGCAPKTSQYSPPQTKAPSQPKEPEQTYEPAPPEEATQPEEPEETPDPAPEPSCDPSYPDVCIPPYPPDLDCGEISHKNFRVVGSDPHRFDGDGDGIGCEG